MKNFLVITPLALALVACKPSNLYDCKVEAAKMPTTTGVAVATRNCQERFGHPPLDLSEFQGAQGANQAPQKPNPFDQFDKPASTPKNP